MDLRSSLPSTAVVEHPLLFLHLSPSLRRRPPRIHDPGDGDTPCNPHATLMQPSQDEIQREVENLRDIRRRSTAQGGPGALILDPDLPSQSAAAQPAYWVPSADDSSSDSHSLEDAADQTLADAADDPFHLFWVPANMHPEIDPGQFRAFLKEHARAPVDGTTGVLARSESSGSTGLGRKKSMLSRQYSPSEHDGVGVEEERVLPLRRNRSSLYQSNGPQLTIRDLEKLDELAEEASQSRDPSKLRSVLRRSLSMNMAPSVIDKMDNMPDLGDDADAPIIVPRPGQILRRAARTKIRKPGQTGEGTHRFTATRRGAGAQAAIAAEAQSEPRSSSDLSTSDHSDSQPPLRRGRVLSDASVTDEPPRLVRPESYSTEASIYDAYATDETSDEDAKYGVASPVSNVESPFRVSISPPPPPPIEIIEPQPAPLAPTPPALTPLQPVLHHPVPQRAQTLPSPQSIASPQSFVSTQSLASPVDHQPSRTPSPDSRTSSPYPESPSQTRPPVLEPVRPTPPPSQSPDHHRREKEKDKKGLFKWGGEKKSKKDKEREKEKDSGFFGSLFGSKKKAEESAPPGLGHASGREAAVALLGASKSSKGYVPPVSPQPAGVDNYSRYPIHVERAIYRLSHIKLANPRRPLYEQVLISNLMFWYLGVINKTQTPAATAGAAAATPASAQAAGQTQPSSPVEQDHRREEKEREERERAESEQAEKEREQKAAGRRSLTKTTPPGATPAGGRRAEMPVRGPQYDMQHRAMEQEYGYGAAPGRPASAPVPGYPSARGEPGAPQAAAPPHAYQQHQHSQSGGSSWGGAPQLPAGARPPLEHTQAWQGMPAQAHPAGGRGASPPRTTSPPGARRSRSPPAPQNRYNAMPDGKPGAVGKAPSRSQSATAVPPMANGGAKGRKAVSAHAVAPNNTRRPRTADGAGEEEDVPLAVWQQQQQRRR
ncbi:hypothetical protein BV25DRAFT_1917838 [Artomyces pyxidatus]|uniref:Uncharacterized protein n=1 Tax=Artomyces pyxidatus TaxID=48021 RepID=A0ACB8SVD9_9AGAM|nr:hypothetical protein BV25DRAFT_1917838 [Artomyces pyxidatus]